MENISLMLGLVLLSVVGYDFFCTTLSGSGAAFLTRFFLALFIRNLGKDPAEVINRLLEQDLSLSYQQIAALQQMIDRHNVNHQAYPVLHYYNNPELDSTLSVNLTVLDEAVSILLHSREKPLYQELQTLRNSLDQFLQHIKEKYSKQAGADPPGINWLALDLPANLLPQEIREDPTLSDRRKVLGDLLKSEALSWQHVYPKSALKATIAA